MPQRLNVLHVIADQHNAGWLGCAGHPQVRTPNLDAFAASGMRFTQAYTQNPICTPSRVSILSGQYCHNHGYYGLSGPVNAPLPNLFGHLKVHGYRTAAYGKLHLPNAPRNWLADDLDVFGDTYERVDSAGEGESEFFDELGALGLRDVEDSWHNHSGHYSKVSIPWDARPSDLPYEHTQERWCVREALRFIDEAPSDRPFCIQLALQKPHHPLFPQQQFWDLYPADVDLPPTIDTDPTNRPPHFQRMWQQMREMRWEYAEPGETWRDGARRAWRGTLACVSQVDDVFGLLLRELEKRGLADNTIIVYNADHGGYHGIHGIVEKAPGICSEAVCQVPMMWRVPGVTAHGSISDALVENVDLAPTLASLCGLPPLESTDGVDITHLLRGRNEPVREVAVTESPWSKSIRFGTWRLVHYQPAMFGGEDFSELYDMENDSDETTNLYHDPDHQPVVEQGRRLLLEWLIDTTRVRTASPPLDLVGHTRTYATASDGKEANSDGPARRVRDGKINQI